MGSLGCRGTNIDNELAEAQANENYEIVEGLEGLRDQIQELVGQAALLSIDDVTDDRFKLEDKKHKFAQALHLLTSGKKLHQAQSEYQTAKQEVMELVNTTGNDKERHQLAELLARDDAVVNSTNPTKVQGATSRIQNTSFPNFGQNARISRWFFRPSTRTARRHK